MEVYDGYLIWVKVPAKRNFGLVMGENDDAEGVDMILFMANDTA